MEQPENTTNVGTTSTVVESKNKNEITTKMGSVIKVNPSQLAVQAMTLGVDVNTLRANYVGNADRRFIKENKLTIKQVAEQFELDEDILAKLKVFQVKEKPLGKRALAKLAKEAEATTTVPSTPDTTDASAEDVTVVEVVDVD